MSSTENNNLNATVETGIDHDSLARIDSITDAVGHSKGPVLNGGYTDDLQPTLSGRLPMGEGQVLRVFCNNVVIGYADIGDDATWSFTPDTPLEPGRTYDFQIILLDSGTSELLPSDTYTIHTTELNQDAAPVAPVITEVLDQSGDHQGVVTQGGKTDDSQPLVSGTADAGSVVAVKVYSAVNNHTYTLGSVVADADGHWSYNLHGSQNITNLYGEWTFTATATNAMGTSDSSAGYSVETVATNADVFATPEIAYIIDDVGLHTGQVTDGGKTDDTQPELHGTGEPGSVVIVTMYGPITGKTYTLGHVTVGNDGTWHYQFTGKQGMQAGHGAENIFHVSSVDTDGHTVTSDAFTVTLTGSNADDNTPPDITPPDAPVITEVYDDVGTQQGPVANGGSTDDSQLKISGTAEHDSIVVISHVVESTGAIYVDGSVVADASGHWVFEMTGPFQPSFGNRIITATATDAAGNTSEPSDSFVVNFVDTNQDDITPPDQPTIDSFHDDAGNSLSGATTDDATPTLQGHAEANSIVNVYEGGTLLGSTIAGADGTWSYTTPERADGMHDFTVTATDAAGNTSAHSADFVVNVVSEIITMVTPTIDSYHDDAGASFGSGTYTDDRDPTLHGHAQAGSIVRVYIDNGREGTAIADADGNWQYTPKYNLLHTHVFTVDSVLQGNLSDTSEKFVINIEPQPESSYHWDFNDETFQGWSVLGEHATSEDGFTNSITTNQRAEFRTDKRFGKDYNGDVMSTKIYVEAGKTYDFSYQYGHITDYKMLTAANVGLTVDGQLVGGYHTATDAAQTITGSWTAKTSGEITLAFNDKVSTGSGNDFWIDNISAVQQGVSAQAETQALTLSRVQTEDTHTDASANNANLIELSTAIQSPAHADITDHVQNTLHLTLSDILSEAHPNLFVQDGKQQLAVTGDQGDVVELKVEDITHAEWQDSGAVTAGGIQYEVYQHAGSDVELLVQHGLELHQVS